MKINKKRIIACFAALVLVFNAAGTDSFFRANAEPTVQDLESQKAENDKKIAELQKKISDAKKEYETLVKDENAKLEYQDMLSEKIIVQNENISYVIEQMNQIDEEIQVNLSGIEDTEAKIRGQNVLIDKNMDLYKQRLRASYMAGDDTLSAVFTGSTSFFDILSKMEIMSKVAKHDNDLVDKLESQLLELKKLNEELQTKQEELNENLADATERKTELDEKLDELNADYQYTQDELDKLNSEKEEVQENIEESSEIIEAKQKEQEKIDAEIAVVLEKMRQESIAESKRVSESIALSIAESVSESVAASIAEEERNKPAVTQAPVQQQPAATQAPSQDNSSSAPAAPSQTQAPSYSAPSVPDSSLMCWPVPGFTRLSSDFWDGRNHGAIDVQGHPGAGGYVEINGAQVVAASDGVVASSYSSCTHQWCGCGGGYGNYVAIQHSDCVYSTYYAHLQAVFVSSGQSVKKGQLIGLVGTTGQSSGPHLHFEVRKNGTKVNPMDYDYLNY